ncbi:ABC transporter permease [Clostridium hydrogeniformans]|uniref:ABC transporter permease n=1 Tax=Clostridium hydrogeniformans TaxID=349933 RepID=UPI000483EAFA|nr:hypothetical protein [Clostridium hydrogeniformans]
MRKINALVKYELINLKRGKLIWIMAILYIFGIEQCISAMFTFGENSLSLVKLIQNSWLPLNFIMIPLILLSMKVGESDDELFRTMNISIKQTMIGKILTLITIDIVILALNLGVAIVISLLNKVSMEYFLYQILGYMINSVICLIVCNFLGLLIGETLSKYGGSIIGFIVTIISFVILCNFYKTSNEIFPLIDIKVLTNKFNVIAYDSRYLYHNLFWVIISAVFFQLILIHRYWQQNKRKALFKLKGTLVISIAFSAFLGVNVYSMSPKYYDIRSRNDVINGRYTNDNNETFFGKEDLGYYVDKYNMDLSINDGIENYCSMKIKIDKDNISSLELGLYKELTLSKVEVDNKAVEFDRTNHSFIINLPREYKKGETINVNTHYYGKVNTVWIKGTQLFFIRNNWMFLGDVFEWYPKLNDSRIKEYTLDIKFTGENKIYSNLDGESALGKCNISGKDRDIFLVRGNVKEREYKGYLIVGNEEEISSNNECDILINVIEKKGLKKIKKIVSSPFVPGSGKLDKPYEKGYLY